MNVDLDPSTSYHYHIFYITAPTTKQYSFWRLWNNKIFRQIPSPNLHSLTERKGIRSFKERTYRNHIIYIPSPSTKKNLLRLSFRVNNVYVNSLFNLNNKIDFAYGMLHICAVSVYVQLS